MNIAGFFKSAIQTRILNKLFLTNHGQSLKDKKTQHNNIIDE